MSHMTLDGNTLPATSKTPMYVHCILDRTGSMKSIRQQTVDAYNEYCNGMAAQADIVPVMNLTLFDTIGIDQVRKDCDPEAAKITLDEYHPRSRTNLYDAIGETVHKARADLKGKAFQRVAFVILTDGEENASREWRKDTVAALLKECEAEGWLIVYLGANQDAMAEGMKFGASAANSMSFNTRNVGGTYAMAATRSAQYARSGNVKEGFTDQQRAEAMKDKDPGRRVPPHGSGPDNV